MMVSIWGQGINKESQEQGNYTWTSETGASAALAPSSSATPGGSLGERSGIAYGTALTRRLP